MFSKKLVLLGVFMFLVSFIVSTSANAVSASDSSRRGYGFVTLGDEGKSQIEAIIRGVGTPKLEKDAHGRVSRIEVERGDFIEFRYDRDGQPIPHNSMLNGKRVGSKATVILLKALQIRQPLSFAGASNEVYRVSSGSARLHGARPLWVVSVFGTM